MAYQKRYEDSYLDKDEEEIPGDDRTDGEKIAALIQDPQLTEKEKDRVKRLTERLFMAARMPSTPGALAVVDIAHIAEAYAALGVASVSVGLWSRLSDIAEANGDRELYFRCMEEITNLG